MSLNGIGNQIGGLRLPQTEQRPRVQQERAPAPAPATVQPQTRVPATGGTPAAAGALPVEAPAGTDPELWAVLTSDERAFFAKAGAMGPLTYGYMISNGMSTPPPVSRGGRLDVRA